MVIFYRYGHIYIIVPLPVCSRLYLETILKVHYLQHVAFEGLSSLEPILRAKGHEITATHLYKGDQLPSVQDLDWLIVMGGPMGIYDEDDFSWLKAEKTFIRETIHCEKIVLGICLGAQFIADALGAKVFKNQYKEIGWFDIKRTPAAGNTILSTALPDHMEVFHWHGDTFEIPQGAVLLASSDACKNQAFIMHDRIVGLQFHLETTMQSARALIENCRDELDSSPYVQDESTMLSNTDRFVTINEAMRLVLEALESKNT